MRNGKLEEVRERLLERSKEELADAVINSQILISRLQQKLDQEKGKAKDMRQTIFGRSSEQSMYLFPMDELQDSLAKALEDFHEDDKVTVREHVRQKRERSVTSLPADTPVFEVDHGGDDPDEVEKDGVVYVKSGTRSVDRIEHVPSRHIIRRDIYSVYTPKDGHVRDDGRQDRLVRLGNRNVDGLAAGPGFIAWILVGKFDDHLPLYRQAEMLARDGLAVSRQRLSFWLMRYGGELEGFWRYMKRRLYQMNLICQDETRVEVLASRTKTGSIRNDSYMFIRVGSSYDAQERRPHVLVLLEYIQGRSTDVLMDDYRRFGYQGCVMSDGLQQYANIPQERHATCWVHAQRPFKKILKKNRKHQGAADMVRRINGLFSIHRQCMDAFEAGLLTRQEFIDERRWKSYPVMLGVLKEASRARAKLPPGDEFAKGCAYILNRPDSLFTYLECFECPPDNNASERQAMDVAVGRGNWLFFDSVDGADHGATFYSIVQSAKANGLDSRRHLELVLSRAPYIQDESQFEELMPWNVDAAGLAQMDELRSMAEADEHRREPYILTGLSG